MMFELRMLRLRPRPRALAQATGLAALFAALAFCVTGCGGDKGAPSAFSPDVSNHPGFFEVFESPAKDVTRTLIYDWENSGQTATVESLTTFKSGDAFLRIFDATGAEVYGQELLPGGPQGTTLGEPGSWRIDISLINFTGTLAFRVQSL